MKPCKAAYKVVRKDNSEIFKGFGFKHLSDATQYYVHPNNQSYKGTTTLCQPIGEAIMLMNDLIESLMNDKNAAGDILYDDAAKNVFLNIPVPAEWRTNAITIVGIYHVSIDSSSLVKIGAYSEDGRYLGSAADNFSDPFAMVPLLAVLIAQYILTNDNYSKAFLDFTEAPNAESFVNLHEDFYQGYKNNDYQVEYCDLASAPKACTNSFKARYSVIQENKESIKDTPEIEIIPFGKSVFPEEYRSLVPDLPEEFVLPKALRTISNAMVTGDVRALLLHGPAGTGKTMSCKLICREIGLPVMETINCTESLDEFVLGKFLPDGDKIVFRESYVTKAIASGGAVIFEEINFARPQHLAFLNSLLDDNGFVKLDNGEIVKRHENFRFFATMNIGYYGTKELNQALYNRFNAVYELAELSDEAIRRMLSARVPECLDQADKLISVYHKLKKKINSEELDMVISPRNIENWARLAKFEGYIPAAEKTIIPVAKCDRSVEEAFRGIIMLYKWN